MPFSSWPNPLPQRANGDDPALGELIQILRERGVLDEEEHEALKAKGGRSRKTAPVAAEGDGEGGWGPTWHLGDALTFTPAMRIQVRYSHLDLAGSDNIFQLRRFRLKGKGEILDIAKYYTELKIDGTGFVSSPTSRSRERLARVQHAAAHEPAPRAV